MIVSNRQKEIIDNANIDAIKDLNGLFNVDDLINKFKNYFFSKMILDATSIVDFASRDVLMKLSSEIGSDKLIILLPSSPEPPIEFKKMLIDLKIYNFSNRIEDVVKFISKPNTYEDVMNSISSAYNGFYVDNSVQANEQDVQMMQESGNEFNGNSSLNDAMNSINVNNNTNDNSNLNNIMMKDNQQNNFANNMMNNNSMPMNNNIQNNMPNQFSNNYQNNNYLNNNMMPSMNNVGNNQMFDSNQQRNMMSIENDNMALNMGAYGQNFSNNSSNRTIIGIKNVTEHAGSTTITYLLMKEAIEKLRKKVVAIEINKRDFAFYHHNNMVSIQENEILNAIKAIDADIIFVDLNNCKDVGFCNDILYLVEPSLIKLNKLMMENKYVFRTLLNRKVVLNKSLLSLNDIRALSSEAGIDIFDNIEPVNDRISNNSILKLLDRMGIK